MNIAFPALIVVVALEMAASVFWVPAYFRFGVPIFRDRTASFNPGAPIPTSAALEDAINGKRYTDLVFRPLDEETFAFRESARPLFGQPGRFSYTPVMHGKIVFDRQQAAVVVTGLANWFPIFFSVTVIAVLVSWGHRVAAVLPMGLLVVGMFGWIYWIQKKRYRAVGRIAASLWSGNGQVI